jgi:hypothetical protein
MAVIYGEGFEFVTNPTLLTIQDEQREDTRFRFAVSITAWHNGLEHWVAYGDTRANEAEVRAAIEPRLHQMFPRLDRYTVHFVKPL